MISEVELRNELNAMIDSFLEDCPFFLSWKKGSIDRTLSGKFLATFDTLVKSFPELIAAGASRMTDEEARTVLAVNLYQECGEGNVQRTHYAIYRKFLSTTGLDLSSVTENGFAEEWRTKMKGYIQDTGCVGAVLGALAAGEYLAQPALTRIYSVLKPLFPGADPEYFEKHLVLEEDHVREITGMMVKEAEKNDGLEAVLSGFKFGLSVWGEYFGHLAEFVTSAKKG